MRIILKKEPASRRDDEIDRVIDLLKSFEFLNHNQLTYVHYRDLAISMRYKEFGKDEQVYRLGEEAKHVFVVMHGKVIS